MTNLGSISEQTLAGVITTATHGSGVSYGVISTNVMALSLLMADGLRVACSRNENSDLFLASICGLGITGIILSVQLEVEPAFRLKETQTSLSFDDVVKNLDEYAHSAEHVRFWWFPTRDIVRYSAANRSNEVCLISTLTFWFFWGLKNLPHCLAQEPSRQLVVAFILWSSRYSNAPVHRTLFPSVEYMDK